MATEKDIADFSQSRLKLYTDNLRPIDSARFYALGEYPFDLQLFGKGGGKSWGKTILSIGIGLLAAGVLGPAAWFSSTAVNWSVGLAAASLVSTVWTTIAGTKTNNSDFSSSPEVNRFDKAQETMSSDGYIPIVYGERKIMGNQVFHETNADQNTLHKHVVLCEGGVEGLVSVTANDLLIPTNNQSSNTVFTIQNIKYKDAGCRKVGKNLYLKANGKTKSLYLVNADDSESMETFWSWQTSVSGLISYINSLGDGWQAFPTAVTSKYPGNLNDFYIGNRTYVDTGEIVGTDRQCRYTTSSGVFIWLEHVSLWNNFVCDGYYYEYISREFDVDYEDYVYTYKRYTDGKLYKPCYKQTVNVTAATVKGGTKYVFHDSEKPTNYNDVGGYTNCAWLDATFISSSELNGNPSLACIIKGKKVYDTRTGETAYSTNPAMCLRDFILSERYGLGKWFSSGDIDEESWNEAANYCDEIITFRNSDGTTEDAKRYELNMVIDTEQSALHWLQEILANFCGYIVYSDGKLKLKIEKQTDVSYHFDDSNTKDIKITPLSLAETPNRYKVNIIDPYSNWAAVVCLCEDFADQKERQKIVTKDVQLNGVTSQHQALRLARFYRDYNLTCPLVLSFTTGMQAMHLEPGDVVTVSYHHVFADLPIRITEIKETDKGEFEITGRQYNDTIYNDELGGTIHVKNFATMQTPYAGDIPHPYNLALEEKGTLGKDGNYIGYIDLTWDAPAYSFIDHYEVYYSYNNIAFTYAGSPSDTSATIMNTLADKTIYVKLRIVNTVGRKSDYIEGSLDLLGKNKPPEDVTQFIIENGSTEGSLLAKITEVSDVDIDYYEIRLGNSWENGTTVCTFNGNGCAFTATENGTCVYWIKAKDTSGNYSVNAKGYAVDISSVDDVNVIYTKTIMADELASGATGMYLHSGYLGTMSTTTIGELDEFGDIFGEHDFGSAEIITESVDCGTPMGIDWSNYYINIFGNIASKDGSSLPTQTLSCQPTGNNALNKIAYKTYYRVSINGTDWTEWIETRNNVFSGHYVQFKIVFPAYSSQVKLESFTISVDVPDVQFSVDNTYVPKKGLYISLKDRDLHQIATITLYTRDGNNAMCLHKISDITTDGFFVQLFDIDGNKIAGTIIEYVVRGF